MDKLSSNLREEQRYTATVAVAPLIEEASTELSLVGEFVGHCARDYRLARTSHTVKPEYTFTVWIAGPNVSLMNKVNSSVWVACRVVFVGVGVKRGTFGSAEFSKNNLLIYIKN